MTSFISDIQARGHEQITIFHDAELGFSFIVAIHSTTRGPSLGGCRMRVYADEAQALTDVIRLSEAMTYKNALADLALGGGKSVLLLHPSLSGNAREKVFLKVGEFLNSLNGTYLIAEDMGTTEHDISIVHSVSPHVGGLPHAEGGSGDPSPWTARGVVAGMRAGSERAFGTSSLSGKHVVIQGVGSVGGNLVDRLLEEGAVLTITDTNKARVAELQTTRSLRAVESGQEYDVPCDIFAPSSIGQTINAATLSRLQCRVIAGAANNQLENPALYQLIEERGILYCPDFVINAGGVISIAGEQDAGGWTAERTAERVEQIYATTARVLDEGKARGIFPEAMALILAREAVAANRTL